MGLQEILTHVGIEHADGTKGASLPWNIDLAAAQCPRYGSAMHGAGAASGDQDKAARIITALDGNAFQHLEPINRYNLDKRFDPIGTDRLEWTALTTGGFGGFDAWLEEPEGGALKIDTELVKEEIAIKDIGYDEMIYANGGIDRRIRIFRLPDKNPHRTAMLERRMKIEPDRDNAYYVRITQEDGHFIWSSPIYVFN